MLDRDRGVVVCRRCELAETAWPRLLGLMGRRRLEPSDGLILRPAASVHTCFMRFPIDAVFLDADLTVLAVSEHLRPWRASWKRRARAVLELPAGATRERGVAVGHRLEIRA